MKQILLSQGQVALVDDEDFEELNKRKWTAVKSRNVFYAISLSKKSDNILKRKSFLMHRCILKVTDRNILIDHKNGNGLDNQKHNIRVATYGQNATNVQATGISQYMGVCWHKPSQKWHAQITLSGKLFHLGLYRSEEEAAIAYNYIANKYGNGFHKINEITNTVNKCCINIQSLKCYLRRLYK